MQKYVPIYEKFMQINFIVPPPRFSDLRKFAKISKIKWPKVFRGKLLVRLIEPKLFAPRLSNMHINNI